MEFNLKKILLSLCFIFSNSAWGGPALANGAGEDEPVETDSGMEWFGVNMGITKNELIQLEPKCSFRFRKDANKKQKKDYSGDCLVRTRDNLIFERTYAVSYDELLYIHGDVLNEKSNEFIKELIHKYGEPQPGRASCHTWDDRKVMLNLAWISSTANIDVCSFERRPQDTEAPPTTFWISYGHPKKQPKKSSGTGSSSCGGIDPKEMEILKTIDVDKKSKYLLFKEGEMTASVNFPQVKQGAYCVLENLKGTDLQLKKGDMMPVEFSAMKIDPKMKPKKGEFEIVSRKSLIKNKDYSLTCESKGVGYMNQSSTYRSQMRGWIDTF